VLAGWKTWASEPAKAFQRASSAVEGRNGYLSQIASQPPRLAQAALQGVDGAAQLRLSRYGWHDASIAFFPAGIS
jgi:hypothetical protein